MIEKIVDQRVAEIYDKNSNLKLRERLNKITALTSEYKHLQEFFDKHLLLAEFL